MMNRRSFLKKALLRTMGFAFAGDMLADGTVAQAQSAQCVPSQAISKFYGINIHPVQTPYINLGPSGPANMTARMQDVGFTIARADFYNPTQITQYGIPWIQTMLNGGILMLPMLSAARVNGNETASYNNGFALGQKAAQTFGLYTNDFEMGNEMDDLIGYTADGLQPTCYTSNPLWLACRGVMRGQYDGVKSVIPGANLVFSGQTVLCEGFTIGMFTGVDNLGATGGPIVNCDSMCWHWYATSGNITSTGSSQQPLPCGTGAGVHLNILQFCNNYNKPGGTWLTEIGPDGAATAANQASYVTSAMTQYYNIRAQYRIAAAIWYELFNTQASGSTRNYGLMEADATTIRPAYTTMKNFIASHPV